MHKPHTIEATPAPAPNLHSITRVITCRNSGVALATLEVKILEGHLAYLESHDDALYLHPLYRMSSVVLLKKLEDSLHAAQESGWQLIDAEKQRLQLLTSAMMHNLDSIKQDQPCLPSFEVAAASAGRLLGLAKWFFYISSQRMQFPLFSVSKRNDNLHWQNFKHWIDSAYEVRNEWSNSARRMKQEAQIRAHEETLKEIHSDHYRRVDVRKVWNWIELQLSDHYPAGRLVTFKNLFLNGDVEAHEWIMDDVDDLKEAVVKHCDIGNAVMHFIQKRLSGIAAIIRDFYSSFTLVTKVSGGANFTEEQTPQEAMFFGAIDTQVEALEELPPPPKREAFESYPKFIQAEAKWRLLKKRWDATEARKIAEAEANKQVPQENAE